MADKKSIKFRLSTEINEALEKAGLADKFSQLPLSHQREYLNWVEGAKKPETYKNRISKMLNMLSKDEH